MYIFFL